MEAPEFLLAAISIISIFVALPSIIVSGIVRAKKAKATTKEGGALRMSELQLLIDAAVDEATAPLLARIEALEEERLLAPPQAPLALEMPEVEGRQPVAHARQTA